MGKIILGIFIGIGLLLCLVIVSGRRSNDSANEQSSYPVAGTPAVSVSAAKLWSDYQANEVAADNAYKGRRLLVQGLVSSISKDVFDKTYLSLATSNEFMPVRAGLKPEYVSAAANLVRGQTISVECDGGGMVVGSPILNDCSVSQDQPRIVPANSGLAAPPEDVAQLLAQEDGLNDKCRGGPGDDKTTLKACDERDSVGKKIEAKGWCWGHDGQSEAERIWEPCHHDNPALQANTGTQAAPQVPTTFAPDTTLDLNAIGNDQRLILNVKTNLPPKTILMASLANPIIQGGDGYFGQASSAVQANQVVQFGPFSKNGDRLSPGNYQVTLITVMAALQPEEVQQFFGAHGERLTGRLIFALPGTSERLASQKFTFKINPDGSINNLSPTSENY